MGKALTETMQRPYACTQSGTGEQTAVKEPRWATEVAQLWPPQGQWEEEYFSLPDTNRLVELSEGELIMPPHPTYSHQVAVGELYTALRAFVHQHDLGIVQFAPLRVRLWPGKIREPDVFFISKEHSDRIGERVCGPPDLVMEVLSSVTWRRDRREKMMEYTQAGIHEYWIVDTDEGTVEVFVLREGAYVLLDKWDTGEIAHSKELSGFEIAVDAISPRRRVACPGVRRGAGRWVTSI